MGVSESKKSISYASIAAVVLVVSLNLLGAWILKLAAGFGVWSLLALFFVGLVVALNIGRFLLWGWMHRRIDLSKSYPLTAIFFPLVALLSVMNGEVVAPVQWFGVFLITLGIVWFSVFVRDTRS